MLIALFALVSVITGDLTVAAAAGRTPPEKKKPTVSTDHIIKDLTIPWPFRKHWIGDDVAVVDSDGDGVSDDTDAGRAKNRRVEFTVLNKEALEREIERKGMRKR
jgi:hypothetical protein